MNMLSVIKRGVAATVASEPKTLAQSTDHLLALLAKCRTHIRDEIGISGARMDYSDTDLIHEIDTAIAEHTP